MEPCRINCDVRMNENEKSNQVTIAQRQYEASQSWILSVSLIFFALQIFTFLTEQKVIFNAFTFLLLEHNKSSAINALGVS